MRNLRAFFARFRNLLNRDALERDLAEEIESDLQLEIERNIAAGMTPTEARRAALIKFGSLEAAKEGVRDRRRIPFFETLARDVMYSVRLLGRSKGWSLVAIVSLALGIGANSALFSLVYAYALQELPVRNPGELVAFRWSGQGLGSATRGYTYRAGADGGRQGGDTFTYRIFDQFRKSNRTLMGIMAFAPAGSLSVVIGHNAEFASGQFVSGNFFEVLRVSAAVGRAIVRDDDVEAAAPVVMMSHRYWERRFASDPKIVGTKVTINNVPFVVAGVTPRSFADLVGGNLNEAPDFSIPLAMEPRVRPNERWLERPAGWWLMVMGRKKPSATIEQIRANFEGAYQEASKEGWDAFLASASPEERSQRLGQSNHASRLQVVDGSRGASDSQEKILFEFAILAVILVVVLLIICANVTNLLLARAATRQRELALRMAVGATRRQVVRQLLTESLVLGALGGAVGLLAALWSRSVVTSFLMTALARTPDLKWPVVGFAGVITGLTSLILGVIPAVRGTRVDRSGLIQGVVGWSTGQRSRLSKSLLIAQVALSLVLLIGAGLFEKTLLNLYHVNPGFNTENIVVFTIEPSLSGYDRSRSAALYNELEERLVAVPGIQSVAFADAAFLSGTTSTGDFSIAGRSLEARFLDVDHRFFETMELPVKSGRGFTSQDSQTSVRIVNEAFARAYFPNENLVGRRAGAPQAPTQIEIIGVVADAKAYSLRKTAPPMVYRPLTQTGSAIRTAIIRTSGKPEDRMADIRSVVHDVDANLPIRDFSTQMGLIEGSLTPERMLATASVLFGGFALVIAMIGLFGLMSYGVARRTSEIGIRMALGATKNEILNSVLREALCVVGVGVVLGLAAALALNRFISSLLFGLAPNDLLTITAATCLTILAALLAAYLPARRASRVDPMVALRHE